MSRSDDFRHGPLPCLCCLYLLLLLLMVVQPWLQHLGYAQTAPITPSGLNTQVHLSATPPVGKVQFDITGGTRPGGGANLFHSFGNFNVPTSNIANFFNETGLPTSNILGRVTGGNISNIFGTIQTTNFGNANLFLMNPAGFLFGPNAMVNVGGMMTFTTADYLKLADNARFNAVPDAAADALLTASPVAAFGFIGSNPAAINFEGGQLTVAKGTGLALVGGDINLLSDPLSGAPSSITAPGRPIQMTSVAGPGEVAADTGVPAPGMTLGNITLDQGTVISTAGDLALGNGSGGSVSIRGGQFVATGATVLTNPAFGSTGQGGAVTIVTTGPASFSDSFIDTHSDVANGGGGAVSVSASDLTLQDTTIMTSLFGDGITPLAGGGGTVTLMGTESVSLSQSTIDTTSNFSDGDGGAVNVTAPVVALQGGQIVTSASGDGVTPITGNSGAVTLNGTTGVSVTRSTISTEGIETQGNSGPITIAAPTVTIVGFGGPRARTMISASTHSFSGDPNAGHAGDIDISGTNVTVTNFALLESFADSFGSFSRGGSIRITGSENLVVSDGTLLQTTTVSQGNAGDMQLVGKHVTITGQSLLSSQTLDAGSGGTVTVTGTEDITLASGSAISTIADAFSQGPAGHIEINTPHLTITGGSRLRSESLGSGPAGTVAVQGNSPAQSVLIDGPGSGIFTDTQGSGAGGSITLNANSITLQNGGQLSAKTSGTEASATGGTILVKADTVTLSTGGTMTAKSTGAGAAGDITVQGLASPAQSVLIDGSGSGIFTNTEGSGAGGNITVESHQVQLANSGTLSARTSGSGNAGNILVKADSVTIESGAQLTSSSVIGDTGEIPTGNAGNITIQGLHSPADSVVISGFNEDSFISSGILTKTEGSGTGGNINIEAKQVTLSEFALISSETTGTGNAGNISIATGSLINPTVAASQAEQIHVTDSQITASTTGDGDAGSILLQTNGNLSVTGSEILSVAIPTVSKGFTGGKAGAIQLSAGQDISVNNSVLTVQTGGNKAGGEILLNGNNLQIQNTSLNSLSVPDVGLTGGNAGNILAVINQEIRLTNSQVSSTTSGNGNAGDISLMTSLLSLEDSTLSSTTSPIRSGLTGGSGGNILLDVDHMTVSGNSLIASRSDNSVGPAGNVTVIAKESVQLLGSGTQSSTITTSTVGAAPSCIGKCGDAGNISITTNALTLDRAGLASSTSGDGNAGNLALTVETLTVSNGSQLSAGANGLLSTGDGGSISIDAGSVVISAPGQVVGHSRPSGFFTNTEGSGAGGNITVQTNTLTMQNGGTISAATSGTASSATGGTITVNAEQVVLNSQAVITADTNGIAPAGVVEVNTGSIALNGGSQIRSNSGAETALVASLSVPSTLTGGTITVQGQMGTGSQAGSVTLDGASSGVLTQSSGNRPGGDINILAGGSVAMTNGSTISASSTGAGNAGNINVNAGNQFAMMNSSVTTQAIQASGGTIKIATTPSGTVHLTNSTISASVLDGTGGGGSVNIDPQFVLLQNSQILAQAVQGPGGNIFITTNLLLPDANSVISASSQFGQNGTITIQSPNAPASGKIQPLEKSPLLATSLSNQRCAALAGGEFSSFTVAGRDSLPAEPGGWLASPLALTTLSGGTGLEARGETEGLSRFSGLSSSFGLFRALGPMNEINQTNQIDQTDQTNEPPLLSLRQIVPPGFLTQTFAVDSSAGCKS